VGVLPDREPGRDPARHDGRRCPSAAWQDQHLGACVAFIGGLLWIGREHWLRVLRNAFGIGTSSTYRLSFWTVIVGCAVMIGWLSFLKVHFFVAVLIVLFILLAHLIVSRVLAETGIPFFRSGVSVTQVYSNLPIGWFSGRDIWFAGVFSVLGPLTTRDGVMGFAMHGQASPRRPALMRHARSVAGWARRSCGRWFSAARWPRARRFIVSTRTRRLAHRTSRRCGITSARNTSPSAMSAMRSPISAPAISLPRRTGRSCT
jgi:hypothetical protein